ncbi:MAG: type II secretion system F family protein [Cytophagales bacterium]|nr:type II secretion system F family protein [Cytophagales bacterium]
MSGIHLKDLKPNQASPSIPGNEDSASWLDFLNKDLQLFGASFSDKKKVAFYMELGILISAGVDIKSALEIIEHEQSDKKDAQLFQDMKDFIIRGGSLSEALQASGKFSNYEFYSVQIGEETGKMPEVLKELNAYYQGKIKQSRQIVSALTYPSIVLTTSFGAVFFMMNFIVPMFTDVFKRFGGELPAITRIILQVSEFIRAYSLIGVLVLITIVIALYTQREKELFRKYFSKVLLKLPIIGGIVSHIYLARFCQSMTLLIGSKIPLLKALEMVKVMIGFYPIEQSLIVVQQRILQGDSLNKSLEEHPIFPKRMISLIKVGEEVNQLELFFATIAQQYTEETEHKTAMISSLMEPFLIIFLGLVVGVILVSMYLPLFQLSNSFG